ncbi:MAG: septum formation initiator family protein [Bacteroidia bacterium]|nr:septum formation initiator family protein [Bacteroidia bacterium]
MGRLLLKLKNKYLLSVVLILVWLVFFDKNDVFTQYELIQKCHKLNAEREYYLKEISNNKTELEELKENSKTLETFAREKYLMKKENEDLFVFLTR